MSIFTHTIEPNAVAIILLIFEVLLHAGLYIVTFVMSVTEQTYISDKLPPVGYIIDKKFKITKNYEHFLNKRPTLLTFIMYSGNLLFSIVTPFVILSCIQFRRGLPYLFVAIICLAVSVIRWYHVLKKTLFTYKHNTFLLLIEMCHMPYDAASTTLLFKDREDVIYTYVVRDVSCYTLGKCYPARCHGAYIEELSNTAYKPEDIRYVPKRILKSSMWKFGFIPAALLLVLSIFIFVYNLKYGIVSLCTLSVTLFINALLLIPWPLKRKLSVVALRHSEMYKDVTHSYAYTFVLVDKSGCPYYYTSDDRRALEKFTTILCTCMGRKVLNVSADEIFQQPYQYHQPIKVLPFYGILIFMIAVWLLLTLLGYDNCAQALIVLAVTFYIRLFRYTSRGEF